MKKLKPQEIQAAIAYFEDAVKESDEIIDECSLALQAELTEQKQHFVIALNALRHAEPENELTCAGCVHNDPAGDAPWPEICYECKRQLRQDMYRNKPEWSEP